MRCCSAQVSGVWESPDQTLEKAEECFSRAARSGAALISFPEQFTTGWDPRSTKNTEDLTGEIVAGFKKLAKKHAIAVIGSFRETFSPKPRNTAIAISRNGEILAMYAKIHLFTPGNEDQAFTPGNDLRHLLLRVCIWALPSVTISVSRRSSGCTGAKGCMR